MSDRSRAPIFLSRRSVSVVLSVAVVSGVLSACKKEEPASCASSPNLLPQEIQQRRALGYADRSPDPQKSCATCQHYLPSSDPTQCGGCALLKGPIHPKGTCTAYLRKT